MIGLSAALCLGLGEVFAQSSSVDSLEDKELVEVLIEDTAGELARNQASLDQTRAIYRGLDDSNATERSIPPQGRRVYPVL